MHETCTNSDSFYTLFLCKAFAYNHKHVDHKKYHNSKICSTRKFFVRSFTAALKPSMVVPHIKFNLLNSHIPIHVSVKAPIITSSVYMLFLKKRLKAHYILLIKFNIAVLVAESIKQAWSFIVVECTGIDLII